MNFPFWVSLYYGAVQTMGDNKCSSSTIKEFNKQIGNIECGVCNMALSTMMPLIISWAILPNCTQKPKFYSFKKDFHVFNIRFTFICPCFSKGSLKIMFITLTYFK